MARLLILLCMCFSLAWTYQFTFDPSTAHNHMPMINQYYSGQRPHFHSDGYDQTYKPYAQQQTAYPQYQHGYRFQYYGPPQSTSYSNHYFQPTQAKPYQKPALQKPYLPPQTKPYQTYKPHVLQKSYQTPVLQKPYQPAQTYQQPPAQKPYQPTQTYQPSVQKRYQPTQTYQQPPAQKPYQPTQIYQQPPAQKPYQPTQTYQQPPAQKPYQPTQTYQQPLAQKPYQQPSVQKPYQQPYQQPTVQKQYQPAQQQQQPYQNQNQMPYQPAQKQQQPYQNKNQMAYQQQYQQPAQPNQYQQQPHQQPQPGPYQEPQPQQMQTGSTLIPQQVQDDVFGRSKLHPSEIGRFKKYFPLSSGAKVATTDKPYSEYFQPQSGILHDADEHHMHEHELDALLDWSKCDPALNFKSKYLATANKPLCPKFTWADAADFCQVNGLQVVALGSNIQSQEELDMLFLLTQQVEGNQKYWTSGYIRHTKSPKELEWRSMNAMLEEIATGAGLWASGQPDNMLAVLTGSPNDVEHCVALVSDEQGVGLHDLPCSEKLPVVCQKDETYGLSLNMNMMS